MWLRSGTPAGSTKKEGAIDGVQITEKYKTVISCPFQFIIFHNILLDARYKITVHENWKHPALASLVIIIVNQGSQLLSKSFFTRKKTDISRFMPNKYRYSQLTKIPFSLLKKLLNLAVIAWLELSTLPHCLLVHYSTVSSKDCIGKALLSPLSNKPPL